MTTDEDAAKAMSDLNGASFMDKTIVVNEAKPQRSKERRSFGGGRGGYSGDRGGFGKGSGSGHRKRRR